MNRISKRSVSKYRVIPRTVRIGVPQTVAVIPLGEGKKFRDDTDYIVQFVPMEIYDNTRVTGGWDFPKEIFRARDGVLSITHTYEDEQEWVLSVTTQADIDKGTKPHEFHIYSLEDDLYGRNPYRGDFHAHSYGSDGTEAPAIVAANYRKEGYDILSLTDHHNWDASREMIDAYEGVPTGIRLFLGEEVHPRQPIHIVSFGADRSITAQYRADEENIHAQLCAEAEKLDTPHGVNALEFVYRRWVCDRIREAGGMCIVPHPFWIHRPGVYNMNTKMLDYVFEQGIFDAFELTGGQTVHENNIQISFYHDQRAKGRHIPIVGSSDSHGTDPAVYFYMSKTVLFAKDTSFESVRDAILNDYSVAVEEEYGEQIRVHGTYRMMRYTRFLLDYYFPAHDELCVEQGRLMREHALGDPTAAEALRAMEGRVEQWMQRELRG